MNTLSSCDSMASSKNSEKFSSSWEEGKSPKMCGHSLFSRFLSPTKEDRSPLSKTCLSPKRVVAFDHHRSYRQMGGSIKSPDTESSTSSSEKSKDDSSASSSPPFIVQFNPDDYNNFDREDEKMSMRKPLLTHARKQNHPYLHGSRSTVWSITLPSVAEERSVETEEPMSPTSRQGQESVRSGGLSEEMTQENMDILLAMRSLILKQQEALKQLSDENNKFRQELAEVQNSLRTVSQESNEQKSLNESLSSAKDILENEMSHLRSEAKALQCKLDSAKSDQTITQKFENLMKGGLFVETENISDMTEHSEVESQNEVKSSLHFQAFADSMDDDHERGTVKSGTEKAVLTESNCHEQRQTTSPFTLQGSTWSADSIFESDDEVTPFELETESSEHDRALSPRTPPNRVTKWLADKQPEVMPSQGEQDSSELISKGAQWLAQSRERLLKDFSISESSSSILLSKEKSSGTREEISVFKERLATIQHRRAQRQSEVARPRGPVVRFGANTFQ